MFGSDGVDKLIELLKKKPHFVWNSLGYQSMIISCIDCIWATIVGCMLNEDHFILKEGIFCLLDILEVNLFVFHTLKLKTKQKSIYIRIKAAPKSIQNLILGCLLDLSDNPKTLTHLLQWEGNENVKIAHFLCELWRIEEKEINVQRDENGFVKGNFR